MQRPLPIQLVALLCLTTATQAQPSEPASHVKERVIKDNAPVLVTFRTDSMPYQLADSYTVLAEQLALKAQDQLKLMKTEPDNLGFVHQKYAQFYSGVKVAYASYTVHSKKGIIESISGHFEPIQGLDSSPTVPKQEALKKALAFVGAKRYIWQNTQAEKALKELKQDRAASYLPQGELVVLGAGVRGSKEPALTWKFDIYAELPLSRAYIFVDAHSGEVVFKEAIMKEATATGTFNTLYSGTLTLTNDTDPSGGFRLRDYTRGNGIQISNANGSDFTDADNNWTTAEYPTANDKAGIDALFGQQAAYDYWQNVHGRNSYDNLGTLLRGTVHVASLANNAQWDGSQMLYGDGAKPLVTLDICGHEIGHGVCQATADLIYNGEPGALNESFSDIWGACSEEYTCRVRGLTKNTWLVGEEIGAARSMSDPRSLGQPAYYRGQNWYTGFNDFGGVHTNSGVMNYWFYLLTQGKTGFNEVGNAYRVIGIGINAAALIAFRAESVYMSATTDYPTARTLTIQAANDIYGPNSCQVESVTRAWAAVGVGNPPATVTITGPAQFCANSTALFQLNNIANTTGVSWQATPSRLFNNTTGTGGQFTTSAAAGASGIGTIQAIIPTACEPITITVQVGPTQATGKYIDDYQEQPLVASTYALDPNFVSDGQVQISIDAVPGTTNSFSVQSGQPHSLYQTSNTTATLYYGGSSTTNADVYVSSTGGPCGPVTTWFSFYRPIRYNYAYSPNPTSDELTVQQQQTATNGRRVDPGSSAPNFFVELYNSNGLKVRTQESTQSKAVLNVRDLPSGLYNVRIGRGEGALSKHIQITH